jgi:hypothetical protein
MIKVPTDLYVNVQTYNAAYFGVSHVIVFTSYDVMKRFIQPSGMIQYGIAVGNKEEQRCAYTQSKPLPQFQSLTYMLQKNSPLTDIFNSQLVY